MNGGGSRFLGTALFIGAIVVFDICSYVFGWGWIIY
jgi:hypothetical protein